MTNMSKREYLIALRGKYFKATRAAKTQLLNDFCEFTKYNRKYALELLNNPLPSRWKHSKPRQKVYDRPVIDALLVIWRGCNEICGERLHSFIPSMLEKLVDCGELTVDSKTETKLKTMSMATVKRIVSQTKRRSLIKIGGTTKPGSLLKHQIAIRYGQWGDVDPGWCETDTVAHCGGDVSGEFIYSLDIMDICTGWSEQAAIWGKGEKATVIQIDAIRQRLPFTLLGLDPDNGSEFINWHLHRYSKKHGITLTRSRPYKKNDNAHVEQKNYTAIRQLIGYSRLERKEQLAIMNDLYANEWRLYLNFFQPTMKLKEKIKDDVTGKTKKRYYQAKTPYQRLLDHPKASRTQKDLLRSIYKELNPIKLQQEIDKKLELLRSTLRSGF